MLICSKERFFPTEVNMLVLETEAYYFYVHRSLYDQAVVLDDLYGGDQISIERLCMDIADRKPNSMVRTFLNEAPKPINILGCYLLCLSDELDDFVDMVGAIHVMSGPLNFRRLITLDKALRNSVRFSLSIKQEYLLSWDRWFQLNANPGEVYANRVTEEPRQSEPVEGEHTADEFDTGGDDEFAQFLAAWSNSVEEDEDDDETGETVESSVPAATTPSEPSAPEPEPETEQKDTTMHIKSGLDFLRQRANGGA